mgnify:CR=1 FL=1
MMSTSQEIAEVGITLMQRKKVLNEIQNLRARDYDVYYDADPAVSLHTTLHITHTHDRMLFAHCIVASHVNMQTKHTHVENLDVSTLLQHAAQESKAIIRSHRKCSASTFIL